MVCGPEGNRGTHFPTSAHTFAGAGLSNAESAADFRERFGLKVTDVKVEAGGGGESAMTFEMWNVSPAFANALRRLLLSEVPTLAIEHVFFRNNTSIVHDEVLAHRLGLVPIRADPRRFADRERGEKADHTNTVVFQLTAKCERDADGEEQGKSVHSKSLEWLPLGSRLEAETGAAFDTDQTDLAGEGGCAPVHQDILLAKLRPGQEIDLEAHCVRGTGAEHAKWSPVATAWYRLKPEVHLKRKLSPGDAEDLFKLAEDRFGKGKAPFRLEGSGKSRHLALGEVRPECLEWVRDLGREPRWADAVELRKVKNHFIFTIESTGVLPPWELLKEALRILSAKCTRVSALVESV